MRRTVSVALLVPLLLVPASAVADDDTQTICTRVVVPPDHALFDSAALRGEPEDGECDAVVYLPPALAGSPALGMIARSREPRELTETDSTFVQLVEEAIAEEDEPLDEE
jgi:hypothetical protein